MVSSLGGEQLAGEFELLEALGHGASSVVYKVKRLSDGKVYAVKLLHSYLVEKEDTRKRFEQEAKAAMLLSHPNILKVHALEHTADGQPYLLMDYLEGPNLAELLKAGRLPLPRAWKLFIQIADALCQAHSFGVIHRSIKPGNIIVKTTSDGQERAMLSDFGLAKLLPSSGQEIQNLTAKGAIIGSPLYMSPEQCIGREIDARADIYSMGCLMYACLTGRPPLKGETIIDTMQKHVSEIPLSFEKLCPELKIPGPVEKIIFKCMAKRPEDRYENVELLKQDLLRYQQGKRPKAMSMSISTVFAQQKLPDEPEVDDDKYLKIALLVILGLLISLVIYAIWKTPSRKDPSEVELGKTVSETQRTAHPISAFALLKQADELRLLRREDEARAMYREAISRMQEREKDHVAVDYDVLAVAHSGLAGLYMHVADWIEAEKELRLALYVQRLSGDQNAADGDRLQLDLAEVLVRQGKLNDAKQILQTVRKTTSENGVKARALLLQADIAAIENKLAEAEVFQLEAMKLLKSEEGVGRRFYCMLLSRYADGLIVQKKFSQCVEILDAAMKEREQSDWNEYDIDAAIYLTGQKARALAAAGKYKEATQACNSTLELLKESSFPSRRFRNSLMSKDVLIDASAAIDTLSGNSKAGIEKLKEQLYLSDRFGHIATMARILIHENQSAAAIDLLAKYKKQALKQPSLKAEYYALMALAHLQDKKVEEAHQEAELAVDALRKSSDQSLHTYCLHVKSDVLRQMKRADAANVIEKTIGFQNPLTKDFDFLVPNYQLTDEGP